MPRCVRCGYMLVGSPPPVVCPECGHKPRMHQRWIEGELHREGPATVLPVMVRQIAGCIVLLVPISLGALLSPGMLEALEVKLPFDLDARWFMSATCVGAFAAVVLWTRPVLSRDAHRFGLDTHSAWRAWLPAMQLPLLAVAALLTAASLVPAATKGPSPIGESLMRWAAVTAVFAEVGWILAMRQMAGLSDYLRDGRVRWSVNTWTWLWIGGLVLLTVRTPFLMRYGSGANLDGTLEWVLALARVGLLWGAVNGALVAWLCVNALVMAHEEVARDDRRAEQEKSRYRVPD